MSHVKDLWLNAYEELLTEYETGGLSIEEAEHLAETYAWDRATNRLADMADHLRDIAKEGRA